MVSGRNIGDRYFAPPWFDGKITYDRSVLINNSDISNSLSSIYGLEDYFNQLWTCEHSKGRKQRNFKFREKIGNAAKGKLILKYNKFRSDYPNLFDKDKYLKENLLLTNKVTVINNPLNVGRKEARVWYEIKKLILDSKDNVLIESPYVVPAGYLMDDFKDIIAYNPKIKIFTNSLYSTLNLLGSSGYTNYRDKLIDLGFKIYEYQGDHYNHSKAFIVDDDLAILGSFNLDYRSANINTETMLVINSKEVVDQYYKNLEGYLDETLKVKDKYNYIENPNLKPIEVTGFKKLALKILHYLLKPFIKLI